MAALKESHKLLHLHNRPTDPEEMQPEHKIPWLERLKGIICAFMLVVCHIVGITNVQLLQRRIPDLELQVFRCSGMIVTCTVWMFVKQRSPIVPVPDVPVVFLYSLLRTLATTATFIGCAFIPVTSAQCFHNSSNMFFGIFIHRACAEERTSMQKLLCVTLCIVGIILVMQPWHKAATVTPTRENNTLSCFSKLKRLCSLKIDRNFKVNSTSCRNHTHLGIKETANPCEISLADSMHIKITNEFQSNCHNWLSCWFETTHIKLNHIHGGIKMDEKKFELFQLQLPQKYTSLIGYLFTGFAGIFYSLVGSTQKRYASLRENIMASLFWSFLFGFISSLVLTLIVESPVWPQSSFDTMAMFLHSLGAIGMWFFFFDFFTVYFMVDSQHNF